MNKLKIKFTKVMTVFGDNEMNITLIKYAKSQQCTKYIEV